MTQYIVERAFYTDHKEILADLSRSFKERQWDELDVIEWCQHVENHIVPNVDRMVRYDDWEIKIKNGQGLIPCFANKVFHYKLEPQGKVIIPKNYKTHIDTYNLVKNGKIYISFAGSPIDVETGLPLIYKGNVKLCYWYCIMSSYTEDYLNGKIDHNRWDYISMTVSMMAKESQQSLADWTDHDYKKMTAIFGTSLAHSAYYKRFKML